MLLASAATLLSVASCGLVSLVTATLRFIHLVRDVARTRDVSIAINHPAHVVPSIIHVDHTPVAVSISIPITPNKNSHVLPSTYHAFYDYYPSVSAALDFTILFAILNGLHITSAAIHAKPLWDRLSELT